MSISPATAIPHGSYGAKGLVKARGGLERLRIVGRIVGKERR
jgi:hypothetical protein